MNALRLEAGPFCELAQDEKRSGARQGAAARVEVELGTVATVEVGASESEVPANGLGRRPTQRYESFLAALAERADAPLLEIDAFLLDPYRFAIARPIA